MNIFLAHGSISTNHLQQDVDRSEVEFAKEFDSHNYVEHSTQAYD